MCLHGQCIAEESEKLQVSVYPLNPITHFMCLHTINNNNVDFQSMVSSADVSPKPASCMCFTLARVGSW